MKVTLQRWAIALADAAHGHPYRFIIAGLLLAGLGAWGTSKLRIDQDLKAFLPPDSESVLRLEQIKARIGAQTDLLVAIESPDRAANIRFGRALAQKLAQLPELRFVIFERDIDFFERRALLYLPMGDLLDLRKRVIKRIRREVTRKMVVDLEDDDDDTSKKEDSFAFDPKARVKKHFGGAEVPKPFIENADGSLIVVKARPTKQTTDVGFSRRLLAKVKALIAELSPQSYHPALVANVRGEYAERVAESSSIFGQVVITGLLAVAILLVLIGGYFRQLRAIVIVLVPVLVAAIATLGVGAMVYGSFNLATAFIFAILLGLGIDFAIHALARYRFEREVRGKGTRSALRLSLSSTGAALLAGAITTISVFWLLSLGRFRGFSQFGVMAGIGVLLALVATFTLVPALASALERCLPSRRKLASPTKKKIGKRPMGKVFAWAVALMSLASAGYALSRLPDVGFEYDFNKLGRKKKPKAKKSKGRDHRDAIGRTTSFAPAVALCKDAAQCAQVTQLLSGIRRLDKVALSRLRKGKPATLCPPASRNKERGKDGEDDEDDEDRVDDGPFAPLRQELCGGKLLPKQRTLLAELDGAQLAYMCEYLRGFLSLQAFIPPRQVDKLRLIADIKQRIDKKRVSISKETRAKLDKWYHLLEVKEPITQASLPKWVSTQFVESDGSLGRFAIVYNGGSKRDYKHSKKLYEAYFDLRVGAGVVPMGANYFVLAEVIDTLKADGPVVMSAAAIAVSICLLVMFRSLRAALLVLIPLGASISWLLGLYWLYDAKINIFNVIAFPLLVGMAVDNGIHVYHRFAESQDIGVVLREVGGPIALTTLTTFVGFSALLIADHVGIQTLGFSAALGMVLGFFGAVLTLPALLVALSRK